MACGGPTWARALRLHLAQIASARLSLPLWATQPLVRRAPRCAGRTAPGHATCSPCARNNTASVTCWKEDTMDAWALGMVSGRRAALVPRVLGRLGVRCVHKPPRPAIGQPLPHTHPHLFPIDFRRGSDATRGGGVAEDHLTPGIPAEEYEQRRRNLMARLPTGSVVVLMGGRVKYMSRNILYASRLTQLQVPPREQLLVPDRPRGAGRGADPGYVNFLTQSRTARGGATP